MKSKVLYCIFGLFLLLIFRGHAWSDDEGQEMSFSSDYINVHTIMKPDRATLRTWIESYENAPRVFIDEKLMESIPPRGSLSLLSHLDYIPSERNQLYCGNCWVWAGTGVMEIALDVQNGVKDRLSIQYLNSCYTDDYACCGGWLEYLVDYYVTKGKVIPWSNTSAHFQDANKICPPATSSDVSCSSISTTPSYSITSIAHTAITTQGVSQSAAITNIKSVLSQNKAIWFGFFLPDDNDWNVFDDFWDDQSEDDIFNYDYSCDHTWVDGEGGGHAVLIVGYNDDDPENSYWLALNSWGTTAHRPHGLFRIDMDMNYDCVTYYQGIPDKSHFFQTLNVEFTEGSTTTTTGPLTTTTTTISSTTTTAPLDINLKPYTPSGWSGPIVPSSAMETNIVNTLCGRKPTYIDIAFANFGSSDITETFYVDLYVDGNWVAWWPCCDGGLPSINAGYFGGLEDWEAVPAIKAGTHTLKIVVDGDDDVAESNENDNEYEQTFTWKIACPWTSALYESMLGEGSHGKLSRLRDFRDGVLLFNQTGKKYVSLLYHHSEEIASLLSEDQSLSSHTEVVLGDLMPAVSALLDGGETTISVNAVSDIEVLLDKFEVRASPELKVTIKKVKRDIRKGTIFRNLGITVE